MIDTVKKSEKIQTHTHTHAQFILFLFIMEQALLSQDKDSQIAAILVVGFHHAYGPIVEFCLPPLPDHQANQTSLEKLELPEEWSFLPFLALPGK